MAKKKKVSLSYVSLFKLFPEKVILFVLIVLFFFFYPGQNYYQTLTITWRPPETISLPKQLSLLPAPYPRVKGITAPPVFSAKAAILMDVPSAVILYQKNPYATLSPASTTKIMTALVALDYYLLTDVLQVDRLEKEGAMMGLNLGDQVTVESLLYGLLVTSGNDAALVLAEYYPGGLSGFVSAMNQKAQELALVRTHFTNVNGFYQKDHYTTALDLARLATIALQNPFFSRIVSTKTTVVSDASQKKLYRLDNVNKLLGLVPGVTGVKTGWTTEAGECLVALAERNGRKILSVILGSSDRFTETARLLEWGFANTTWEEPLTTSRR